MLAGPSLAIRQREHFCPMGLVMFPSVLHTLVYIKLQLSVMISPFWEEVFYLCSFWAVKEKVKIFFSPWSLLFLKNNLKIVNIQGGIFWSGKLYSLLQAYIIRVFLSLPLSLLLSLPSVLPSFYFFISFLFFFLIFKKGLRNSPFKEVKWLSNTNRKAVMVY